MSDQNLTCTDCGKQFTFTESEQEFYQSKGFSTPGRCPDCRAARKAARNSGSSYGSGSGYSGGSSYGVANARCTRRFAPSVARTPRCRSRPAAIGPFTAPTATAPSRAAAATAAATGGSRSGGRRY